jgi:hypothetical protein
MSDLFELAERCEKAIGPDRALGLEILTACGWRKSCVGHFYGPLYYWNNGEGISYPEDKLPCPTASLDMLNTLLVAGQAWTLGKNVHHHYWQASINALDDDGAPKSIGCSNATKTAPLALCAAILRSRGVVGSPSEKP